MFTTAENYLHRSIGYDESEVYAETVSSTILIYELL